MPTVTIGIQTYNRKDFLEIMAASLYRSDLKVSHNIRIFDDCSSEYGIDTLKKIFPTAKSIKINNTNLKADKNMYQMYLDFLSTEDDYFFNADSDIIFNKQWLNTALEMIEKTDGVLSLFNAISHKPYQIIDDLFCLKRTIGAAGTLFKREHISKILEYYDSAKMVKAFDWQWCEYFTNNNIKIFCLNKSIVQHFGYKGQNSVSYFDMGRGFKIETLNDGQIINDIFIEYLDNIFKKEKIDNQNNNSLKYHVCRCFILIFKKIMPNLIIKKLKQYLQKEKRMPL
jgi:hypothetical protein